MAEGGELENTFAYNHIKEQVDADRVSNTDSQTSEQKHYVISTMRVERYYSSVQEHLSPLSSDALIILRQQDYVGFFKSCGSNYVRGIRRAQEVTAIFTFTSSSTELAQEYAGTLKTAKPSSTTEGANPQDKANNSKYSSINNSLEIKILGYGLGLSGAEGTLVASTLEEYNKIMKYAFQAMTQTDGDAQNVGMIYGIEVVPWVDNTAFQVASNIYDEAVSIALPRSSIAKAFNITNRKDFNFDPNNRTAFTCKDPSLFIDKYGYCCGAKSLYDTSIADYNEDTPHLRICRPVRSLDKSLVKTNMASNGEFVARLDAALTYKMNQFSSLEKCTSMARMISTSFDSTIIKRQESLKQDGELPSEFSVQELRLTLDPFNDYTMVTYMGRELEEYVDMFYTPCINALFGANAGKTSDVDSSFFMAYPWYTHKECSQMTCLSNSMRWDRNNGGCTASLLTGSSSSGYDTGDSKCSYDADSGAEVQECKYPSDMMHSFYEETTNCWNNTLPSTSIVFLLEYYCMPALSEKKISAEKLATIQQNRDDHCTNPTYEF